MIPHAVRRLSLAAVAVTLLLGWVSPAAAQELPVLLVHGFCSSATTWDATLPQLSTRRYGDDAPRLYEGPNGTAVARTPVSAGSKTFRIDFSDLSGGFDLLAVANVPTRRKAGELKAVIDGIKRITGAPGVIIVGTQPRRPRGAGLHPGLRPRPQRRHDRRTPRMWRRWS